MLPHRCFSSYKCHFFNRLFLSLPSWTAYNQAYDPCRILPPNPSCKPSFSLKVSLFCTGLNSYYCKGRLWRDGSWFIKCMYFFCMWFAGQFGDIAHHVDISPCSRLKANGRDLDYKPAGTREHLWHLGRLPEKGIDKDTVIIRRWQSTVLNWPCQGS